MTKKRILLGIAAIETGLAALDLYLVWRERRHA